MPADRSGPEPDNSMIHAPILRSSHWMAIAIGAGALSIGVGLLVLVGWWAQIETLKRVFPGMISMNPAAAICFIFAGASLCGQVRSPAKRVVRIARLLALVVFVVGVMKLVSQMLGWEFQLDQWFFPDRLHMNEPVARSRIAPNTSLALVFLGMALLFLDRTTSRGWRWAEVFALGIGLVALLALVGYVYQVSWLYGLPAEVPMALHTAATFLVLALGIMFARPDQGMMALVMGESSGGLLARRMFPATVLVFTLAGILILAGERLGYYEAESGMALHTVTGIGIFGAFVLWSARSLHKSEMDRKRVTEERERFFSLSLDLLCIAGMDGYFKRVNPAFSKTLGYSTEEILSRPFLDFLHLDDVAPTLGEMETLGTGMATMHFENRYRCKDGSWKWLAWNTQPFVEEGILYAVGRDVTEQKDASAAILSLNAELLQQTCRLESLNQELEAFSYSVSHDLRAPLRGISGFAEALEENAAGNMDDTSRGYLQRVRNAAARMGELIDDLLQLSRLTRAEMRVEAVDLSMLADSIVAGLRQVEPGREVEVSIAPDIRVVGDPALLRVLLDNLLGNAWKFTSKNPAARIEMGTSPGKDGKITCFVRDNGAGFDNRYVSKLFGAFQRLHSQAEFPGTGIGLATVQRVVHRHGGIVSAEGRINHGATFCFTLEPVT